jgi:hypothetical protein
MAECKDQVLLMTTARGATAWNLLGKEERYPRVFTSSPR